MREMRSSNRILIEYPKAKSHIERAKRRWGVNIKTDIKK
jgi:hypothetical protein